MTSVAAAIRGISVSIEAGPPDWLVVPRPDRLEHSWLDMAEGVLSALADADRLGAWRGFGTVTPPDPESALAHLVEIASDLPDGVRLVAGLSVPFRWPLAVLASVSPEDRDHDLIEIAGGVGGHPVEYPVIDELPDGSGPVVLRYDVDDDGVALASVCCVRRTAGVDTKVLWRTTDLGLVAMFTPSIVDLMGCVTAQVIE